MRAETMFCVPIEMKFRIYARCVRGVILTLHAREEAMGSSRLTTAKVGIVLRVTGSRSRYSP